MAELKVHDYDFDPNSEQTPQAPTEQISEPMPSTPERPDVVRVPASPARRLKSISRLEKFIVAFIIVAAIGLSVLTISVRTNISQMEHDISLIQAETTENQKKASQLEQEKNELSKTERIKKVAEEKGLSINDDNLRKVD